MDQGDLEAADQVTAGRAGTARRPTRHAGCLPRPRDPKSRVWVTWERGLSHFS